MSTHYSWEHSLGDILRVVNPTEEDWNKRFEIMDDLKAVVESLEILRGATVEPFGSFVSNLFTRWSDLDISIELSNGTYISTVGNKYKESLISEIQQSLKINGGFYGIKSFYHARVPILKCDRKKLNISCNISINNLKGQMKSKILLWISDIDERIRDVVLLVKEWAKTHGVNDPKTGTLSSYSLSLLVIFHFQTCEPAILPPLNEIYQGNMFDDLYGVRAVAEQNIENICHENINRIKSDKSRTINRSSLAEIFISFLAKFCDMGLRASDQGISPYNGQWEDIKNNMPWQPKTYQLFIEDPFEQPLNCARGVNERNLHNIVEAFQNSLYKLTSANKNRTIDVLVRPEILSIMSRQSVLSLDNNIGMKYPRTCTNHMNSGLHAARFEGNPVNRFDPRPRQAAHGQVQRDQSGPNNGVNHRPGQAPNGRVQRFAVTPKNGFDQKRGQASDRNRNNGLGRGPGQVTMGEVEPVRTNPKNGFGQGPGQVTTGEVKPVRTNPKNGSGRTQQSWKPKSEK